jgi:ABC-2 type transport system permease protein
MSVDTAARTASFGALLLSEWTKLRSLRSTVYTLAAVVVIAVGLGALIGNGTGANYHDLTPADRVDYDPTSNSLQSFVLVQLAVAVLGVLMITSEFTTGMIRTSLVAVPSRTRLLAAKGAVVGGVALGVGQLAAFGSFLVAQVLIANAGAPSATLATPAVLRAVVGMGLYLTLVCLLGLAVGALIRATAGAIVVMVSIVLIVPIFTPVMPEAVAKIVGVYWPTTAGARIVTVLPDPNVLAPWVGLGLLAGFVAVMLVVAALVFRRRDA